MTHRPHRSTLLALLMTALCAWASPASAQPGVPLPTSWELQRLILGVVNATVTLPVSVVACNVDPASIAPSGSARWDDPAQFPPTRVCQWTDPGDGPIRTAVPGVQYQMRMSATENATDGPSPFSALVDFRIPTPTPAVPTGVRIRPGQ